MAIKKNLREADIDDGNSVLGQSNISSTSREVGKSSVIEKVVGYFNTLGINSASITALKERIMIMLGSFGGMLAQGYDAVIKFLNKGIEMIAGVLGGVLKNVNASTMVGGKTLGFWVFWAVAGSILAVVTVKLVKWLRSKFVNESYGAQILLNTELIKNESLILKEAADEPGFVTKKVLTAGVNAVQEIKNVSSEMASKPDSKAKTFMQKFGKWIMWAAAGALVVLAAVGFYKHPEIFTKIKIWFTNDKFAQVGQVPGTDQNALSAENLGGVPASTKPNPHPGTPSPLRAARDGM